MEKLPVVTIVFNNNGVYRGTDVNPTGGANVAPTVFVKGARYDKVIEAFGGIGYHALLSIAKRFPVELTLVRGSDVQTPLAGEPADAVLS
jgi:oxalyl-CoA decarboxylase